eukprot:6219727-Amphidinium_carterae.1
MRHKASEYDGNTQSSSSPCATASRGSNAKRTLKLGQSTHQSELTAPSISLALFWQRGDESHRNEPDYSRTSSTSAYFRTRSNHVFGRKVKCLKTTSNKVEFKFNFRPS